LDICQGMAAGRSAASDVKEGHMAQDDAKSIFLKIIDLPSEQRLKEQAAMCGDDAALREAVQALIEAHERAQAFLATPAPTSDSQRPTAEITEAPGMTVGRYKLLQQIGEGGFGVVYMAEQREPVKRTVAL